MFSDKWLSDIIKKHRQEHGHHISTIERHRIIAQAVETETREKVWKEMIDEGQKLSLFKFAG